jgi:MFS family permease
VPSALSVLTRNRDFRALFAAELVVFGSDWFVMVPLLVLLPELTGSHVWGGFVLAIDTGINALLLPFTGTVADRLDRKKIMMIANVAAFAGALCLLSVRSAGTAWLGLAAVAGMAVAKSFYSPAASAALPNLVDEADLAAANAVAGSAWGTMTVVGASLGGVLASAFSPYWSFIIAAVFLAGGASITWRIRRPMQQPREAATPHPGTLPALAEALRYIRHRPRVLSLVTVKSAVALGNGVLTVFPLLAAGFGLGGIGTGLLFAVRGAGSLVGPLFTRRVLSRRGWLLNAIALSMSTYGLAYLGVSAAHWFPLVLALVFLAHFAGGTNWMISSYALQEIVPDRLRGRVFATDMMIATLAVSASQLLVTAVVDTVSASVVAACCGGVTLLYAIGWRLATRRVSLTDSDPVSALLAQSPA